VPTRRVWRYKPRVEPMTELEWSFFLVRDRAGFDRIWEKEGGGGLFMLYYADGWKEVYAAHRKEIEAEWNRRRWTQAHRKFVMTGYFDRGFRLAHDIESDRKLELWRRFEAEGRIGGDFREYLKLNLASDRPQNHDQHMRGARAESPTEYLLREHDLLCEGSARSTRSTYGLPGKQRTNEQSNGVRETLWRKMVIRNRAI